MQSCLRHRRVLATSIATLLTLTKFVSPASAQSTGVFSTSGALGTGDFSADVGLNTSKTYLQAIDLGDTGNTTVNGVIFTGSGAGVAPSGAGWSLTGTTALFGGGGTVPAGSVGSLTNRFVYGGNPANFTLSGLNVGETYVLTFYNRSWESAGQRVQDFTASGASSGSTTFDEDIGAGGQGNLNLLRYTFQASSATQTISIAPQNAGNTMHLYAFTAEQAFNNQWTGGANWTSATWTGAQPNGIGSNASFTSQGTPTAITLDADRTLGHLQFDGGNAWTLNGASTLTLQTDVGGVSVLSALSGAHTVATPTVLASDVMKTGSGAVSMTGAVSGSKAVLVNGGTLTLNAVNTYSGGTTVNSGATLRLGVSGALGATNAPLVVNAGGAVDLNGTSQSLGNLAGTGGTIANDATGTSSTLTIGTGDTGGGTFSGVLADHNSGTGTLALTKTGTGTITLAGANSYTGLTSVTGGRLQLNGSAATGTLSTGGISVAAGGMLGFSTGTNTTLTAKPGATFALAGGALALDIGSVATSDKLVADVFALTANSTLALAPFSGLNVGATYTLATYNTLSNPGSFTLGGTTIGRLTMTPVLGANAITVAPALDSATWNNSFGGSWMVGPWANYTPTAQGDSAVFGPALTASGSVSVDAPLSVGYLTFNNSTASYTIGTAGSGNLTLNNGASSALVMVNAGTHVISENVTLASDASVTTDASTALTMRGVFSGAKALSKYGPGTLVLTNANTFTGGTAIVEGTLQLGDGTTNGSVLGNINDNGALVFSNGAAQSYAGVISGTGSVTKNGPGTLTLTGTSTFTGGMTIDAGTVDVGGGTAFGAVPGTIVNNGTLRLSRTGNVTISNVVNGTGTTILTGGVGQNLTSTAAINTPNVTVGDALQGYVFFGAPNQLNGTAGVILNIAAHGSNSRINLNGFNQTVAGLTGTGIVQNHENAAVPAASFTINVPGTNSYTWSGLIRTQSGGALSLVKAGTGEQTMIFSVANGSYGGATTISEGRLTFGSTYAAPAWGTSGINVAAGAEVGLTGSGPGVVSWGTNNRVISGAGGLRRLGADTNTITIANGSNSYTGPTTLSGTGTLSIASLGNIGANSAIGAGLNTDVATNAASLVLDGGTLLYTGGAVSSNRLFTLTPNGGTLSSSGTGAVSLNNPAPIALGGSGTRSLSLTGTNTGNNILGAALSDGPGGVTSITKAGAGTWVLSGATTYNGATTINAGRLQLEGAAANSSTSSNLVVNTGATFGFGAGAANTFGLSGAVTLGGGTVALDLGTAAASDRINATVLIMTANSTAAFNQVSAYDFGTPYTLATYNALINSGGFTLTGVQAGRMTLNPVIGANAITLTPVLDNAIWNNATGGTWGTGPWIGYTPNAVGDAALFGSALTVNGTVTVAAPRTVGYITFNNAAAAYTIGSSGSANLTVSNSGTTPAQINVAAGNHVIAEDVALLSDAVTNIANGMSLTVSGGLVGATKSLTKLGAGTLVLSGTNNFGAAVGSGFNINQGTVMLGSSAALNPGTGVGVNGGTLDLNGNDTTVGFLSGTGGAVTDSNSNVGTTTLTVNQNGTSTFAGALADGGARSLALVKSGTGGVTLTGANTFSSGLTLVGGNLIAASSSGPAIPGNITLGSGGAGGAIWLISGAATQQYGPNTVITWNNGGADAKFELRGSNQTLAGIDGNQAQNLSIIQNDESSGNTIAPGYTVAPGPATLTLNTATDHSFYGIIRDQQGGALSIVKNGPGTQELINHPTIGSFNYTGSTTINGGKLVLNLAGPTAAGFVSNITVNNPGTLGLDGDWTLNRSVTGSGNIVKQGAGTVTVSSALSHTGTTTVASGTLALTGSISGSSTIEVQTGAILNVSGMTGGFTVGATQTLKGGGLITGPMTVDGTLAPGSSIGVLGTDALALGSGSTFAVEINTSDLTSDQLFVNGTLTLGAGPGPTLTLADLGSNVALASGTQFTLVNYQIGGWDGGLFRYGGSSVADGGVINFGANQFQLDYDAGGSSVALIVVPEPSAMLALMSGVACVAGMRRRTASRRAA